MALCAALALLLAEGLGAQPVSQPADPFLALGIRQVRDGDFEQAVFTLDTAVRKLSAQPGRSKELAQAYLYLGVAYVGLDHDEAAKGKFREALSLDPELRIATEHFPPRVVKVFNTQLLKTTAARKKRSAKLYLILGGIAAAGAVGVSAITSGGPPENRSPTVVIGVAPEGQAITGVTAMRFTASASDPDADSLSYSWDFGDGSTASLPAVSHVFASEGTFRVSLTVTDGRGGSTSASQSLTARTLTGLWKITSLAATHPGTYQCRQDGAEFDCPTDFPIPNRVFFVRRWGGTIADPRRLRLFLFVDFEDRRHEGPEPSPKPIDQVCEGEVSSDLNTMRCTGLMTGLPYTFQRQ